MAKKQIIKSVFIDREGVVKIVPAFNDPRTVLVTGLCRERCGSSSPAKTATKWR